MYPIAFGDKGFGLVAGEFIPKETFIIQYIGEILSINSEEGKKRTQAYSKSTCTYMMRLSSKEVIDPTYRGNMARFINHSCDPNCETRKWNVLGEIAVGIFSVKDIQEGEELSFDYKFDVYQTPFTRCLCGTAKCKGYLGLVPVDFTLEEWEEKIDNLPCEICGNTNEDENNQLLLCDICNNGYHTMCCNPPIKKIPQGAWFCSKCQNPSAANQAGLSEPLIDEAKEMKAMISQYKPVKKMLYEDKRMRNYYLKNRKKEFEELVEQKTKDNEENEDLHEYTEMFNYQKKLQFEVIKEFLDELRDDKKNVKKKIQEAVRVSAKREKEKRVRPQVEEIVEEKEDSVEEDEEEEESESEAEEEESSEYVIEKQKKAVEPKAKEATTIDEKIKQETSQYFHKLFDGSQMFEKMKSKSSLAEINSGDEISRSTMPISAMELFLFKGSPNSMKIRS